MFLVALLALVHAAVGLCAIVGVVVQSYAGAFLLVGGPVWFGLLVVLGGGRVSGDVFCRRLMGFVLVAFGFCVILLFLPLL